MISGVPPRGTAGHSSPAIQSNSAGFRLGVAQVGQVRHVPAGLDKQVTEHHRAVLTGRRVEEQAVLVLPDQRAADQGPLAAMLGADGTFSGVYATKGYPPVAGERSVINVISLGAKTRSGGPQNPVPRLV